MNAYLEEIIQFVEATGMKILPCINKKALIKKWQHRASNDREQIREWLQKWPNAQVAAVVPDNMGIFDFDPRHEETPGEHDRFKQQLPETRKTISGRNDGGEHWWYYVPPGTELAPAKIPKGVDLPRAGKNYVIIPPSLHNETGQPYTWAGGQLAHLSEQAIQALQPPHRIAPQLQVTAPVVAHSGSLDGLVRSVSESVDGERNQKLFWAACRAFDHGNDDIMQDLFDAALTAGLSGPEASSTIASAERTPREPVEPFIPAGNYAPIQPKTHDANASPEPNVTLNVSPKPDVATLEPATTAWDDAYLRSHQRIAARLTQYATGRALYINGIGWHYWTGTHWAPDHRDAHISDMLTDLLKVSWLESMYDQALQSPTCQDEVRPAALSKFLVFGRALRKYCLDFDYFYC